MDDSLEPNSYPNTHRHDRYGSKNSNDDIAHFDQSRFSSQRNMKNYHHNNVNLIPKFNIKDVREENQLDVAKLKKRIQREQKNEKKFKIVHIANRRIQIGESDYEMNYKHGRNFSEFLK